MTISRDELAREVAKKLNKTHTYADTETDVIDGSFEEVIDAVIETLAELGPVIDGD